MTDPAACTCKLDPGADPQNPIVEADPDCPEVTALLALTADLKHDAEEPF